MPFIAKSAAPNEPYHASGHWTIDQAVHDQLTVFSAPPGYLATEGIADALRRRGRELFWVRLGAEDSDPGTFLLSVLTAVRNHQPRFGGSTLELMRRQPGPIAGWPRLFGCLGAELSQAISGSAAIVLQHVDHLSRSPALALLSHALLPAMDSDVTWVLVGQGPLPNGALPGHAVRRSARDLRLDPGAVAQRLERGVPELRPGVVRRMSGLSRGISTLTAICSTSVVIGASVVERGIRRASSAQELLGFLARAWLQTMTVDARRALALILRLEYSHPALAAAVLGEAVPASGPWVQQLTGGWSRIRSVWREPLWSVLSPDRLLGPELIHRAADFLLDRGATERAIPLYLELQDATCAAQALADEADHLVDLGQWDTLGDWLGRLPDGTLRVQPRLLHDRAELEAAAGRVEAAERGFAAAASLFAARYDQDGACRSMLAESALAAGRKDFAKAHARAKAASLLADTAGLDRQQVWASWQLGCLALAADESDSASAHFSRAATIASKIGDSAVADIVVEAERLTTNLQQVQRKWRHHWDMLVVLQHAERQAASHVLEHIGGGPDWVGGLLGTYGWSGTPLGLKVPAVESVGLSGPPPDTDGLWCRLQRLTGREVQALALPAPEQGATPSARTAPPTLTVQLLGQLRVSVDDVAVGGWATGRGRSLFQYLVTHRDPWPRREELMEIFWPSSSFEAARNSLNVAVHGIRRALRAAAGTPVVVLEAGCYRLDSRLELWVDIEEFQRHVDGGRQLEAAGELATAAAEYELAIALYQGDFLAGDPYEEWSVLTRERLRMAYLDTLDRLSHLHFTQHRYGACATLCQLIVGRDPCREDAHRRLMRCFSRQGQTHMALRQYQACTEALRAELGVDPNPATIALRDRIRQHQPV